MTLIDRRFRLAEDAAGLGLCCANDGVFLAGAALLRKAEIGWAARDAGEINALLKAAYGGAVDPTRVISGLVAAAKALNQGDLGRAMIASVQLRLPDIRPECAQTLRRVDEILAKYNDKEPRDWHGRWTTGGSARPATPRKPNSNGPAIGRKPVRSRVSVASLARPSTPPVPPINPDSHGLLALQHTLESKFDNLDPVTFSKRVYQFGTWLYFQGGKLNAEERLRAKSEYAFLQSRLSFWIDYKYTPTRAHGNLLSAAIQLYGGANYAGLVHPGDKGQSLPHSFLAAGVVAGGFSGGGEAPGGRAGRARPEYEAYRSEPPELIGLGRLGALRSNRDIRINWGPKIKEQGLPFERAYAKENPEAEYIDRKVFDFFWEKTQKAVSVKTLDTLRMGYIKNPRSVYDTIKKYIDDAAGYNKPRVDYDLDPRLIKERELQLGIRESVSPEQLQQVMRAWRYAGQRGVRFVVTRIRDD